TQYQAQNENAAEWTFSKESTPNVPIRDALRASMAFPGAFLPWPVRVKNPDGTFKVIGYFADGGILSNFPIEVFDSIEYSQRDYPITTVRYGTKNYSVNPCSLGMSLAELGQLDESVTPI